MDNVTTAILEYVKREYLDEDDDQQIDQDTPLISSGIVDSFSMVSLKRFVEKTFAVKIADSDATTETFDTARGVAALVAKLKA